MIDTQTHRAYAWYREHGFTARASLTSARAECEARLRGWRVEWQHDDDPGWYPDCCWHDGDPRQPRQKACGRIHECEGAVLVGTTEIDSLWGIWDANPAYRRAIESDLYLDALAREAKTISLTVA